MPIPLPGDVQPKLIVAITTAAVVAAVAVAAVADIRAARRAARIERQLTRRGLPRSEYWGVYSDVLDDLGGLDGEASTDSGRLPPRP